MRVNKGWKEIYKNLSWYNRRKLVEANRPFGKDPKEFRELVMWILAGLSIFGVVLNVHKDPAGFLVWMFTNACWAVIDFTKAFIRSGVPVRCVLFLGLVGLDQLGKMNWSGGEKNGDE